VGSIFSTKSHLSAGYRYRDGHLLNIVGSPVQESNQNYLFECFIGSISLAIFQPFVVPIGLICVDMPLAANYSFYHCRYLGSSSYRSGIISGIS